MRLCVVVSILVVTYYYLFLVYVLFLDVMVRFCFREKSM